MSSLVIIIIIVDVRGRLGSYMSLLVQHAIASKQPCRHN